MSFELHFDKPPLLHNDDKKKRFLLREALTEIEPKLESCDNEENICLIDKFFEIREVELPHGNMYYRIITKPEKEDKKFAVALNGKKCSNGCTPDKLVKWCAKCNDRERDRKRDEEKQNLSKRLDENKMISDEKKVDTNGAPVNGDNQNGVKSDPGVASVGDLSEYLQTLTLNDVAYEHIYAEGISFTVADVILFVYMYYLLVRTRSDPKEAKKKTCLTIASFASDLFKIALLNCRMHSTYCYFLLII